MTDAGSPSAPRLYRATIEYDGSDFIGFQLQAQGRTVQGELEATLERLTQEPTRVIGAGRTDAGVHAAGQVISFRSSWQHGTADLHRGLNALLPADLAVHSLQETSPPFHPRFSASERWYRYQIGAWPGHSPLRARYAWEVDAALDLTAMNEAAVHLVGSHDFASFGQPTVGEVSIRTVTMARWQAVAPYFLFDIRANAFLRRMVRNLVATLVWVGQGRITAADVAGLLADRDRSASAPPAPPQGLILMAVIYPDHLSDREQRADLSPSKEYIP